MLSEDIKSGYAPAELTFMGYKTKNLHHSEDAVKAFQDTIAKAHSGSIRDHQLVKDALMHTDQYMKLNDMHLEQGEAPTEEEVKKWVHMHEQARRDLEELGEFPHHMDYWHNHLHELQFMRVKYTPEVAGAEMADSYTPEGNMVQEELSKTIKPADRVKVARVIADMLGVENAESMSPDTAVNQGLRKIKNKRMTPEFTNTVKKMVQLAQEVGIKVDQSVIPAAVSEEVVSEGAKTPAQKNDFKRVMAGAMSRDEYNKKYSLGKYAQKSGKSKLDPTGVYHNMIKTANEEVVSEDKVNKKSTYNAAKDIMRFNDFAKSSKINQGEVPVNKFSKSGAHEQVEPEQAPEKDEEDTIENVPTQVGATMTHPANDQLRRRKVAYKLGEEITPVQSAAARQKLKQIEKSGVKKSQDLYNKLVRIANAHPVKEEVDYVYGGSKDKKIGEVGKDRDGNWYAKHHHSNFAASGFKSRKEAENAIHAQHYDTVNEEVDLEEATKEDLRKLLDKHTELAVQANKAGDDEAVKKHQGHINAIKKRMAKVVRSEEVELEEDIHSADYKVNPDTGRKYRARHIEFAASKMGGAPSRPEEGDGEERKRVKTEPIIKPVKENYEEDEHDGISTESDLDDMVKQIEDEEDILDAYDEDELVIVDQDTGEIVDEMKEEVEQLDEVLTRMERMRAKIRFARTASKRSRRLQIALRSRSSATKINARARRLAVKLMKQRLAKKPLAQMTVSDKERAEKIIQRRKAVINRLAMKLAPRVRKIENARLSHSKVTK